MLLYKNKLNKTYGPYQSAIPAKFIYYYIVGINGGIILAICFIFLCLFNVYKKKIFLTLYTVVSFIVFELGIGLFEGLYNHVLKNILFFMGMPLATWRKFFPEPAYEIPGNLLFESTGILQFLVAIVSTIYLLKIYKKQ